MPGGTSGAGGGKNPTTTPTHADPGEKPGSNTGRGGKAKSTGSESDILATIMAMAQASKAATTLSSMPNASAENAQFNQQDFLAAKNALDEQYVAAGMGGGDAPPAQVGDMAKGNVGAIQPTAEANEDTLNLAQVAYDRQLRNRRADALNTVQYGDPEKLVNINKKTHQLTWDEYNDLSGLDKASVDFNTMLTKAVKRDRRMQDSYSPDEQQKANYDAAVEGMFPSGSSGDNLLKYAPETVALLNQVGYNGDQQGDLNDFLNLKAAITDKDLKRMDVSQTAGIRRGGLDFQSPVMEERMNFKTGLANMTADAQAAALQKGNELLANFKAESFDQLRSGILKDIGGLPRTETGTGFGMTENDQLFQGVFDVLANQNNDPEITLYAMQNEWTPAQRKQFVKYAEKKLLTAEQDNVATTTTEGAAPRSPLEIAQILKLRDISGSGGVSSGSKTNTAGGGY